MDLVLFVCHNWDSPRIDRERVWSERYNGIASDIIEVVCLGWLIHALKDIIINLNEFHVHLTKYVRSEVVENDSSELN